MSTHKNLSVMLAMAAGMASLLPASASDCITRTTTYVQPAETMQIVPQSLVVPTTFMPSQTVKTTKTTVTTTPLVIAQPTIISTPDTVSRTVIMMGSAPSVPTTSMITTTPVSPYPVYGNRLAAMNEQIDRSLANGWISKFQADGLRADSTRLNQMIITRSPLQSDTDSLERGLTGLNIAIQNAMKANGQTATTVVRTTF